MFKQSSFLLKTILVLASFCLGFASGTAGLGAYRSVARANAPVISWCEMHKGSCGKVCREHKLTIVLFHANWCPACKKMEAETFSDAAVREKLVPYGAIRVDVDLSPEHAGRAGIKNIPTVVVLNDKCTEVARVVGNPGPAGFLGFLDGVEQVTK